MHLTDQQLLELIETKPPEELTLAEIDQLRRRLTQSTELQEALAGRLSMDRYLADALGRVDVSVDEIIARAGHAPAMRSSRMPALVGGAVCVVLLVFVGIVLVLAVTVPPGGREADDKVAQLDPAANTKVPGDQQDAATAKADPGKQPDQVPAGTEAQPTTDKPAAEKPTELASKDPSAAAAQQAAAVKPEPEKKPAPPAEPWDVLALGPDGKPAVQSLFEGVTKQVPPTRPSELKQWFGEVAGQKRNVSEKDYGGTKCAFFEGLVQLKAPLKSGTALRMSLAEYHNLKIHFWLGSDGITLQFYENFNQSWIAYSTTRKQGEVKPTTLALAASDEDRYWRTNPGQPASIQVRYENKLLTLSRGDVRVLSVPMAAAPAEVYFEGRAVFRHLAMTSAAELPAEAAARPLALDVPKPATLAWMGELPEGGNFQKLDDGRVELSSEKSAQQTWVAAALPQVGLHELVVQLDDPQPGTGIYLGDENGKERYVMALLREQKSGRAALGMVMPGANRHEVSIDPNGGPALFAAPQAWFKFVFGCGLLKCWTSIDGIHWARTSEPFSNLTAGYSTVGLYCVQGNSKRSIRLRHLQLRELTALNSLAPLELREQAPAFPLAADMGEWLERVLLAQPSGVDNAQWRRACAVRTLAAGASATLGMTLLDNLLEDGLRERADWQQRIELLDEVALLTPTFEDPNSALRVAQNYERLGQLAYRAGTPRPYTKIAHAQMTAPIWSRHVYNYVPDALVRAELLELVYARQWAEVDQLYQQLKFWHREPAGSQANLLDWADALALQQLPKNPRRTPGPMAIEWRHPLVTDLSKEGYNVLAEFEAALEGKSYRDACQIISTAGNAGTLGLLPDAHDPALMVSLPGAVALAMRDHPVLRSTMSEQFGQLGKLRIRQAITEGDSAAVEAATLQFLGTEAAAEAHLWLGDKEISGGAFARSLGHYRQARKTAGPALKARIAASEQLAAAMMGQTSDDPVSGSVEFGQTKLSAAELEALVTDLRKHRAGDALSSHSAAAAGAVQPAPAPSGFEVAVKVKTEGELGDNPQNVPGELIQFNVDWVARQMGVAIEGDRLILSNRFQVAVYSLGENKWLWRTGLGGDQAYAHEWTLMPMRPLVTPGRIFVRRLQKQGPTLAALESATGKLLWSSKSDANRFVVSDPLLIQDELFALCITKSDEELTLSLCTYDPQSGALLSQRPLSTLRNSWWQQRTCQVAAYGDSLIVSTGGSVLCCDLLGQVRWVRRQEWIPPALDRSWLAQDQDVPVIDAGRLYVAQPGVRNLLCLDPESGRVNWSRVLSGLRRVIAVADKRVVVQTDDGVAALDALSGEPLWRSDMTQLLDGQLCGGPGGLLVTRAEKQPGDNQYRPTLVWIDLATGQETQRCVLESLKHDRPKLGPLVVAGDRLLAFSGHGDQEANRELLELVRKGDAQSIDKTEPTDRWTRHVDRNVRQAAHRVLPKWTLLEGRPDPAPLLTEFQGEKDVLSTKASPGIPLRLAQQVTIPPGGKAKLVLQVGNDPQGKWKLEVRIAGKTQLEQVIDQAFTGGGWKTVEVDLAPFAGQSVWVVVRQVDEGGPQPFAKWKAAEVIF